MFLPLTRRAWMRGLAYAALTQVASKLTACAPDVSPEPVFQWGVASGDPRTDRVVLWTRVLAGATPTVPVSWEIARDAAFTQVVARGEAEAAAARDFTVKVDAASLEPATTYYYRFHARGHASPIGRTRTAPAGPSDLLRFAVVSCSALECGYFHAYRDIALRADLDAVIHLGDLTYEFATGLFGHVRDTAPAHEVLSLEDYRTRHAHYRGDPDLRAAMQQHPWIAVWDDHEFANDAWENGAAEHDPVREGDYQARKRAAAQAYLEWMPLRESDESPLKIWRTLRYGDLAEVVLLDTRIWGRETQMVNETMRFEEARQLLGRDQESWVIDTVTRSTARWKIVAQQVFLSPLPVYFSTDRWDGYPAARARLLQAIRTMNVRDVVVLTGDIHCSWACEVAEHPEDPAQYDPATGRGALAVEFVAPAVSSVCFFAGSQPNVQQIIAPMPHVKYAELAHRGWMLLDVDAARVQASWMLVDHVEQLGAYQVSLDHTTAVEAGRSHLVAATAPRAVRSDAPALAPFESG